MYDVYLGGVTTPEWREEFKSRISSDISVFDPYIPEYQNLDDSGKSEQIARELYFTDECKMVIFYIDESECKSVRLQIGDAVGHDKQVIVCLQGEARGAAYIKRYCEYRGVLLAESLDELIRTVEEYSAELELCELKEDE